MTQPSSDPIGALRELFDTAVRHAAPAETLTQYLPEPPKGRTLVVAAGKAAASMAAATEAAWPKDSNLSGIALTRYGHGQICDHIEVLEAAHPVPDDSGFHAAQRILADVAELGEDDLLLCLISGGGSSLLVAPSEGITLEEKKTLNKALLMSGAPIGEMNAVRKHISAIKGGRLAQLAAPARVVTLAISDVPHDDPSTIASGPTVPDPTTLADARGIVTRYGMKLPASITARLEDHSAETPKQENPIFQNTTLQMIATPGSVLRKTVDGMGKAWGSVASLGADLEGEARDMGRAHAMMAVTANGPTTIVSGGESTVTVEAGTPCGRGGRNCEYLLALAIALDGAEDIWAIAADTDGIDGSEDNAGAVVTPDTLARAKALGMDAQAMLDGHDAYTFFQRLGDLVMTGPTRTNINDFRAIWIA
ncbi:glycerate kinase [Ahrensia sp. R2A130]|uniref:glycerate kinase type-2 family protein n=1 Tax=Ahrensia sp. R2A130 TaxID=744979 RepID=UPI0001E0F801|nr:glycerate kinase [Ahrensia sp. R2A130]EFL90983.1 glycerate kinase [Ahrensia sp. R2A130]